MRFIATFLVPLLAALAIVLVALRRLGFGAVALRLGAARPPATPARAQPAGAVPIHGPAARPAPVLRMEAELRAELRRSGLLSPDDDPEDDGLVLVHNGLTGHDVILFFIVHVPEDEPRATPPANLTARGLFAALNEGLPPRRRFRKLGELAAPVPADVYRAPEPPDA